MLLVLLIIIALAISGCTKSQELSQDEDQAYEVTTPDDDNKEENELPDVSETEYNDFSIRVGNKSLALMDWDNEVNLEELFGVPIEESEYQLGPESDTFSGSYLKEISYEGLELKLFSPKDNGQNFYIFSMSTTNRNYQTMRGIRIGDTLENLTQKYSEIKPVLDGKQDGVKRYVMEEGNYNYLVFEVENNVIINIRIYHEFA